MNLLSVLFVITLIKYSTCNEISVNPAHDKCKLLIETAYQEQCTILRRPSYMGFAMLGLRDGNDTKAIEFCRLVPEGADCVLNNLPTQIPNECKSLEDYQSKIVVAQHDKSYSEYYCANNMQYLRDRSELDGMDCLYVSAFYNCKYETHKTQRVKFSRKEEYCRDYSLNRKCHEHWGTCDNQKVRNIELGMFDVVLQGMECLS